MKKVIRGVLFDFGGVLTLPQDQELFRAMIRYARIAPDEFLASYRNHRFEFDRGSVDRLGYWRRVCEENKVTFNRRVADNLALLDIKSWTNPNDALLAWAGRLRDADIRVGVLSNMPADYLEDIRRTCPWLDDFDPVVVSGVERANKPEKAIYLNALSRMGLDKKDVLFIDDTAENVAGAERAGIAALQYRSVEDLDALVTRWYELPSIRNEAA